MVQEIRVKSILNKHKYRDDWFLDDYSVNPYMGCSFNCVYCYLRGSKYGSHQRKILTVKINAPEILERQLSKRARKGEQGFIAVASQEPYLPIEKEYRITRRLLTIIANYRFPVHIITKSTLVTRDLDILKRIHECAILPKDLEGKLPGGVIVSASISTLDRKLAGLFEPGAPPPFDRLETMKTCSEHGFRVGINYIPVLPFISDSEEQIEKMIKAAYDHGIHHVYFGGLTLFGDGPDDCRTLVLETLRKNFPDLVPKYLELFGGETAPSWKYQQRLEETARRYCRKYGVGYGIIWKD